MKFWEKFGDLRKLRGYSHETAVKPKPPKKKRPKLKVIKGGKR